MFHTRRPLLLHLKVCSEMCPLRMIFNVVRNISPYSEPWEFYVDRGFSKVHFPVTLHAPPWLPALALVRTARSRLYSAPSRLQEVNTDDWSACLELNARFWCAKTQPVLRLGVLSFYWFELCLSLSFFIVSLVVSGWVSLLSLSLWSSGAFSKTATSFSAVTLNLCVSAKGRSPQNRPSNRRSV